MSVIFKQIKDAQLAARKAREADKATSLTTLIGEITARAKNEGNREVTDKDCISKLTTFRDNAKANAQIYGDRRDEENFGKYSDEAALYESFLPAAKPQYDAETLNRIVRQIIASRLAGDGFKPKMGTVMSDLKTIHDGKYDPKAASAVVKVELDTTPDPS